MTLVNCNCTEILQKIVILTSFVEIPQAATDLKPDCTVSQICQLKFKKPWDTHLWVSKSHIVSLMALLLLARDQNLIILVKSINVLKNKTMTI